MSDQDDSLPLPDDDEAVAPEIAAAGGTEVSSWDETPGSTGVHVPTVRPEDDVSPGIRMVEDGLAVAEDEQRDAAEQEFPEEKEEEE